MSDSPTYYKVTGPGGTSHHGGTGKWTEGRYRTVKGPIVACSNGLHFCTIDQLPHWLGPEVWEFEPVGDILDAGDKLVCAKGRIVRKVEAWNETTARLFAADCAEHVLPLFEKYYPGDDRPRKAIEAARAFARGQITRSELAAARAAAWAARDATWAARAAAWAARDAAWAARAAAWAARDAAWDARAAAGDAEIKWQGARLQDYLEGRAS